METAPRGAKVTGFFKIERYALTLKERAPADRREAGEYQKALPGRERPRGNHPGKSKHSACKGTRSVATNPECKGAQIFQTSHRQIADVGGRGLLLATELYFLHKIRLNFRALKASQPAREAPVS
jgi:hypothetical protein